MPKRVHSMFPKFEERSRLYLIGGHDGSIKIGQSKRIRSRAMNHRQHMLANFAWVHVFGPGTGLAEYSAKLALKKLGRQVRNTETFYSIVKADAIAACRELIDKRRAEHVDSERRQIAYRREQAAWKAFRAQYMAEGAPEAPAEAKA